MRLLDFLYQSLLRLLHMSLRPKLTKKSKIAGVVALGAALLLLDAVAFYQLGRTQDKAPVSSAANPIDFTKQLPHPTSPRMAATDTAKNHKSSGYFYLNGVITARENASLKLKLPHGETLELMLTDKTSIIYHGAKQVITALPLGSNVIVTGTIKSDGRFDASVVNAPKTDS